MRSFADRILATAAVTGALLLVAPAACAAPRYASPSGGGDCLTSPCDLETAVEGASDGDEVIIAPGDYGSPGAPLASSIVAAGAIDIHGLAGASRPRIFGSADPALAVGAGAALRDVAIHHSGGTDAFDLEGFAERVVVESQAAACTLAGDGALLRDSVCRATQDGPAVRMTASSGMQLPPVTGALRNVTAYSQFGEGIRVTAGDFAQLVLNATNVLTQGGSRDVRAEVVPGSPGDQRAEVNLDYSNYSSRLRAGGGQVTAPGFGANQTSSPQLLDDPLGDFHQLAHSPTIDAGVTDDANGPFDFEGQARAQQRSTDIGADEFPAPPPVPVVPRSTPDRTAPILSALTVRPSAFPVRRGATIRYRLSERATVTFTVERRVRGRMKGKRCLTRRRTGRRCTRYVLVPGSFSRTRPAGATSLRFTGRVGSRRLSRARYRLVAVPRDAAGNSGSPVRTSFRIRRR